MATFVRGPAILGEILSVDDIVVASDLAYRPAR
jgi:hypothetical protein